MKKAKWEEWEWTRGDDFPDYDFKLVLERDEKGIPIIPWQLILFFLVVFFAFVIVLSLP